MREFILNTFILHFSYVKIFISIFSQFFYKILFFIYKFLRLFKISDLKSIFGWLADDSMVLESEKFEI